MPCKTCGMAGVSGRCKHCARWEERGIRAGASARGREGYQCLCCGEEWDARVRMTCPECGASDIARKATVEEVR